MWTQDEAGPYQTRPYPGPSWQPSGQPVRQSHEYIRNGTAKLLTLFHPASGHVCVKGVTSSANLVLHPWLKEALSTILQALPRAADDRCRNQSSVMGRLARRLVFADHLAETATALTDVADLG